MKMKIKPANRSLSVVLLSAATLAAFVGCSAARKMSAPQETATDPAPKKEYQWSDMSQGKAIFGQPSKQTPAN
jgi:hypothetical protein